METFQRINLHARGPVVSFDTRLGKSVPEGMVLDFSERQFRQLCQNVVPSAPEAANCARINITPGKANGAYYHEGRQIEVQFAGNVCASNSTLRYGIRHFLADRAHKRPEGGYYDRVCRLRRLGFGAIWGGVLSAAICTSVYEFSVFNDKSPPAYIDECIKLAGAIGLGGVGMALPYWTHPSEIRARYTALRYSHIKPLALRPKSDYK